MNRLLANIDKWGKEQSVLNTELAAAILAATKPFSARVTRLNALKTSIEKDVMENGAEQIVAGIAKCIITGRGSYDWKEIALAVRAPEEVIEKHTTVDWKAVAEEVGYPKELEKKYYTEPKEKHAELKLLLK